MVEHNPFDDTVWDPLNPEQAVEDPLHGPSVVHELLSIPPMPLEDGRFYQPGAFYVFGTNYVDKDGQPLPIEIGKAPDMMAMQREMLAANEWIAQHPPITD